MTTNRKSEMPSFEGDGLLIGKAVTRASQELGLKQSELADIVGVSASQISKIKDGHAPVVGKAAELALYLVRVFRSLDAISGGDMKSNRAWIRNANSDLNGIPAELLKEAAGLVDVMNYLDASRAPL